MWFDRETVTVQPRNTILYLNFMSAWVSEQACVCVVLASISPKNRLSGMVCLPQVELHVHYITVYCCWCVYVATTSKQGQHTWPLQAITLIGLVIKFSYSFLVLFLWVVPGVVLCPFLPQHSLWFLSQVCWISWGSLSFQDAAPSTWLAITCFLWDKNPLPPLPSILYTCV